MTIPYLVTGGLGDFGGGSGTGATAEEIVAAVLGAAVPADYDAGTVGYLIGNNLDATVSSRAATGVTVVTRSHTASTISIIRGDDYDGTAQDAFTWDAGKNIDGGSVTFTIRDAFDDSSIFTTSGSASGTTITVSLTDVQTLTLPIGTHKFDVQLTLSGGQIQTVAFGDVTVIEDQTRA